MITRRKLLSTSALAVPAIAVAGCANIATPDPSIITNVIQVIQNAVATVAKYIPTIESITSLAVSLFGPQWTLLVTVGSQALNSLIAALESITPPVVTSMRHARLAARSSAPAYIGTVNGIQVTGWY